MSVILDALRRKTPEPEGETWGHTARTDSVLATLGYPRRSRRRALPLKTVLMYCGAAMAVGFGVVSLLIVLLAPSGPARPPTAVARHVPAPPSRDTAAPDPGAQPVSSLPPLASSLPVLSGAAPLVAEEPRKEEPAPEPGPEPAAAERPAAPRVASADAVRVPEVRRGPAEPPPREPVAAPPAAPPDVPRPKEDHFGLALYYQHIGDYDNALTQYRALLEQNDGSAEVHNNLGLLYQVQDQFGDAIKQFQRAIAINPKYTRAHNNLGVALMRSGQIDAAAAEFRVALAADPRNVESLVNLALIHRAAGRAAEARDLLQRAVAIDPRNAGSHYNLAVAADQAGDTAIAIEHYRAFLKLGAVAQADLSARVRARLAALGG